MVVTSLTLLYTFNDDGVSGMGPVIDGVEGASVCVSDADVAEDAGEGNTSVCPSDVRVVGDGLGLGVDGLVLGVVDGLPVVAMGDRASGEQA